MSSTTDVRVLGGTLVAVGLSALIAVRPTGNQAAVTIKIATGGSSGVLYICPIIGNSLTGTQAGSLISSGYPLGSSEVLSISSPATFFLAATGVTMVAAIAVGYTTGYTLIT